MIRVALVNMPFANVSAPSYELSLLAAHLRRELGDQAEVAVFYLNQDFAEQIGPPLYEQISGDLRHHTTGVGDWWFRQAAFPELPDNSDAYFKRYYGLRAPAGFRQTVERHRRELPELLAELAQRYRLAEYDVVGFTSMFAQTVGWLAMARTVKDLNPRVITIMGGANCEWPMGGLIAANADTIDFVFSGPGLVAAQTFVERLLAGRRDACHEIPGVLSRSNLRTVQPADAVGRKLPYAEYPNPDYESFREQFTGHRLDGGVAAPVSSSRRPADAGGASGRTARFVGSTAGR